MRDIVPSPGGQPDQLPKASDLLIEYEYWLRKKYGVTGAYLVNAKCFLKTYKHGGKVKSQLRAYIAQRGPSLRSILNRFFGFLEDRNFKYLINDLNESNLPVSTQYIQTFLNSIQDRLRSKGSATIYKSVLRGYFRFIKDDVSQLNKRTAAEFILSPKLSVYSKRLYKAVLKSFCEWILDCQAIEASGLSRGQKLIRGSLKHINVQSLREVISIKVVLPRGLSSTYHKGSLSEEQRTRLLLLAKELRDRALLSLMAWNGLRTIEVLRLNVQDVKIAQGKLSVWGTGKREKSKDTIKLSSIAKRELQSYINKEGIRKGKLFQDLTRPALDTLVNSYFLKLGVKGKFSPHSLRHTTGQLMYEKKIPLELIQKTLRHADIRNTIMYSQRAIDKNYFLRLKKF